MNSSSDPRFIVVKLEAEQHLILPMQRPYLPVPSILMTDWSGFILIPIWMLCSGIIRVLLRIQPPPRARFVFTKNCLTIEFVARNDGERSTLQFDPRHIVELRKNRFDKGLWIHVRGKTMDVLLRDIDDETTNAIANELQAMREFVASLPE
jgi:hypothetical protein